ncbi:hypothetical protein GUJ93_ZPchr0012g21814 [Zizania palustris]|uniref:Uncharacterized protein n=1 Tax=Zizania palustris TaxID=103762 RepID=A0A8J6BTY5_ZIZPA|nr:hypothetical protein GUJ93_ZPchr0012g21814 [Zizania palustris]
MAPEQISYAANVWTGTIVPLGSLMRSLNISGAGMECLNRKSRTWFSGMDAVDSSLSLGIRKVALCGIFSCTILMSMTKAQLQCLRPTLREQ